MKNIASFKIEHRPFCASCSWLGLTNILMVGGLGVEDIRMSFATFSILLHRVYFCKVVLKRKSTDESKKINGREKQIPENLTSLLLTS